MDVGSLEVVSFMEEEEMGVGIGTAELQPRFSLPSCRFKVSYVVLTSITSISFRSSFSLSLNRAVEHGCP